MTISDHAVARELARSGSALSQAVGNEPSAPPLTPHAEVLDSVYEPSVHLKLLAQSIALECPSIFADHVAWARVVLARRDSQPNDLALHLKRLAEAATSQLSPQAGAAVTDVIDQALHQFDHLPEDLADPLHTATPLSALAQRYLNALLQGERHEAIQLVLDAAKRVPLADIYLQLLQPVQREIGRLWQTNRISVAEEHFCTATTQLVVSQLSPYVFQPRKRTRTLLATCVAGELHELGTRMLCDLFELNGWNTYHLGANTPHESVISAARQRGANVVAISATMPCHLDAVRQLIVALRAAIPHIRILVGGYAFLQQPEIWRKVGADAFGADAEQAIQAANALVGDGAAPVERALTVPRPELPVKPELPAPAPAAPQSGKDNYIFEQLMAMNNELANLQRERARAHAELVRLNNEKNQFLGMAAHDLRSPLGIVLSYSEFLEEEAAPQLSPEHREFISIIKDTSKFMLNLVQSLLDLTAIESGKLRLTLEKTDLSNVVAENARLNQVLATKKAIRVEVVRPEHPAWARADREKLQQVLNNLLANAIKFSPPGTTVVVTLRAIAHGWQLAVRDEGPGIPEGELSKLFKPFSKTSVAAPSGELSTGLGLAICSRIIEGHGGRIWADSRVGAGSTFFFEIPSSEVGIGDAGTDAVNLSPP